MTDLERRFWIAALGAMRPYDPGGFPGTNCSIFGAEVLDDLFGGYTRGSQAWDDIMIRDPARPWSPIERVIAAGHGRPNDWPPANSVCIVQGWRELTATGEVPERGPRPNGHLFFYVDALSVPLLGGSWVVNSNEGRLNGVRPLTWGEARGAYPAGVRLAVLG